MSRTSAIGVAVFEVSINSFFSYSDGLEGFGIIGWMVADNMLYGVAVITFSVIFRHFL